MEKITISSFKYGPLKEKVYFIRVTLTLQEVETCKSHDKIEILRSVLASTAGQLEVQKQRPVVTARPVKWLMSHWSGAQPSPDKCVITRCSQIRLYLGSTGLKYHCAISEWPVWLWFCHGCLYCSARKNYQ